LTTELYLIEVDGSSYSIIFSNNTSGTRSGPYRGGHLVSVYKDSRECVLRRHGNGFEIERTLRVLLKDVEPVEKNIPRIIEMLDS